MTLVIGPFKADFLIYDLSPTVYDASGSLQLNNGQNERLNLHTDE
jgi:hypothetical protein